jgi:hypothetical protein
MQPHPILGDAFERPVQRVDMLFDLFRELGIGQILIEQHPFHRPERTSPRYVLSAPSRSDQ